MMSNAPTLTSSDTTFATAASRAGVVSRPTSGHQMLRVNKFAAAIDMMAAGTNAPIATAANATPANHDGNMSRNNIGTARLAPSPVFGALMPAASAINPSSAIRPSRNEYAGSAAALRRITLRSLVASTPVMECGYMNRASADPRASVQ